MRVLHFLMDGRVGGAQVRIARVHSHFMAHGIDIETMVSCPPVMPANFFSSRGIPYVEFNWMKPSLERPLLSGLRWITTGLARDVGKIKRVIAEAQPDVVHVNGAILLAAVIGARLRGVMVVWHLNDTSVPRIYALAVRLLGGLLGVTFIAASHAVINYYGLNADTQVFYPPGPDVEAKGWTKKNNPPKIGVLSNLSPGKGVETAIAAFADLREFFPQARLQIVGRILENKRWYFEELQRSNESLGVEDGVDFLGFVQDTASWLKGLDLLAFASEFEAAPVAVIEAMACGVPVVACDIPPSREVLSGAGLLVPVRDYKAMTDAMVRLLEDDELRAECVTKGIARYRKAFAMDMIAAQYKMLYQQIIGVSG